MAARAIARAGEPTLKERWLPRLATGEAIAALALSEPHAGSDAAALLTTARLEGPAEDPASIAYVDGTKHYVVNGRIADAYVVLARTRPGRQPRLSLYVVPRSEQTIPGPRRQTIGLRRAGLGAVSFESAVAERPPLGAPGRGFRLAMEAQDRARLEIGAAATGAASVALRQAADRASAREAFGRRLADFGMVQSRLAEMACAVYVAECAIEVTAGRYDAGGASEGETDDVDLAVESAISKILGAEAYETAALGAMDIAAGMGTLVGYPFERHLRDARSLLVFGGSHDVLRAFIALSGLQGTGERLQSVPTSLRERIKGLGLMLTERRAGSQSPRTFGRERLSHIHPNLVREGVVFEQLVSEFARETERVARKHGESLTGRQFVQRRIANVAIELYGLACVLTATTRTLTRRGPEHTRREFDLAVACAERAALRVRPALETMDRDADELLKQVAARVVGADALRSEP